MREKLIALLEEASEKMDCPQMNEIADHLIANGVTVQDSKGVEIDQFNRWIPVSERLPENCDERVLVMLPSKCVVGLQNMDTDRYRGEHDKWLRYGDKVTHWMLLPEPPKEVT